MEQFSSTLLKMILRRPVTNREVLCDACKSICSTRSDLESLFAPSGYRKHRDCENLRRSRDRGCVLCRMFLDPEFRVSSDWIDHALERSPGWIIKLVGLKDEDGSFNGMTVYVGQKRPPRLKRGVLFSKSPEEAAELYRETEDWYTVTTFDVCTDYGGLISTNFRGRTDRDAEQTTLQPQRSYDGLSEYHSTAQLRPIG
jgi:hypothetical protein